VNAKEIYDLPVAKRLDAFIERYNDLAEHTGCRTAAETDEMHGIADAIMPELIRAQCAEETHVKIDKFMQDQAEQDVRNLLLHLGRDPNSEALKDTPARVVRAWGELLAGYELKAENILKTEFAAGDYDELVLVKDIPFFSTCEHHLLLFHGVAHVGYVPGVNLDDPPHVRRVVGLSKIARLVEMHARRLQLQERMTASIAADLLRVVKPLGVGVVVEAQHMCMCARGISKPGAKMVTSVMRGCFREKPEARAELMNLAR
jgi:GTP cyclohydrolase I